MVRLIPAQIENDRVVPAGPLPSPAEVRSVSILVEMVDPSPIHKEATLAKMVGIIQDPGDWKEDCREYLEKKHH